jgi:hypothetical protein
MQKTTSNVVDQIVDTEAERTFWEVVRHHERPPYFFENEGVGNRLARAARVVTDERITPNSDGSYTVTGSENRQYRVTDSCSCPQSQKGKSKHCYHMVAVALYIEWKRRLRPVAPVVLGTLRAGTASLPTTPDDEIGNGYPVDDETLPLPLPPTTIDERLAAAVDQCVTHALQEDRMPDDDDGYIPEPESVSTAILEPPVATRALTPASPQVLDLEVALQAWTTERAVVRRFLKQELQANIDYYSIRIGGKDSKPSLSKAGAEKVMGWLKLQASFTPDTGTWEMLGKPQDLVCYVCTLRTRSGEIVGEGRGARSIKKDNGDVNKAIKMAEKSANVSAVLRTGCLSDVFTQDLEEETPAPVKPATPNSSELRRRIWSLVTTADASITNREACEAYVQRMTGLTLEPNNYSAIEAKLQEGR